ncbi:MAG: serpin family protein [Fimbriimonadales bacterium]|nr:serpin family protein [Fimbriimonadales bacterium]
MRNIKLLILLSFVLVSGCGREAVKRERPPYTPVNIKLTSAQTDAHQKFALDLIRETCLHYADQNLIFSPLSVQIALAMTAHGIDNANFKEIARAFGMPNATRDAFNQFHSQLYALFKRPSEFVAADSVNALFYNQLGALNPDFEQTLRNRYNAEIRTFDPADPSGSAAAMNDWVKQATNGEIEKLIEETDVDNLSLGFFLNAFILDAEWDERFNQAGEHTFYPETGEPRPIPMLRREGIAAYADATTIILRVPFKGGEVSYYILMPRQGRDVIHHDDTPFNEPITLNQLLQQLTPQRWKALRAKVQGGDSTELFMPRFNLASTLEFEQPLRRLGIVEAWENADFSRMFAKRPPVPRGPDLIDFLRQAAQIEVTAERVRVSGATAAESAAMGIPQQLFVDRPFVYLIVHEPTGVIMHAGVLRYPPE